MVTRTYVVGDNNTVRRRDGHSGPWVDVSIPAGVLGTMTCLDVMADPNNPDRVVVVGNYVTGGDNTGIVVSYDAGVTWFTPAGVWQTKPATSKNLVYYEVWWVDSTNIWVIGNNGSVARSLDGGTSFNLTSASPENGVYPATEAIHALDSQTAIVTGATSRGSAINDVKVWITADGGNTWNTLNGGLVLDNGLPGINTGSSEGIWISADQQEIIVATRSNQFRSTDAGATFSMVVPEIKASGRHLTWWPSHAPNPSHFRHVGGDQYNITESIDGGVTWAGAITQQPYTIKGAHYHTAVDGYAVIGDKTYELPSGTVSDAPPGVENLRAVWTSPWPPPGESPCGTCPEGMDYNALTGLCEGVDIGQILCNPIIYTVAEGDTDDVYGNLGARFYEDATLKPFPLSQVGSSIKDASSTPLNTVAQVQNALWGLGSINTGRLNTIGIWTNQGALPLDKWIGFTACVETDVEKVYCIGIGADNYVRFKIDGVLVFEATTGATATFNNWYVIPITLAPGTHNIELEGLNLGSAAAFGAEIYDADVATLAVMTTEIELAAVTVFTTGDQVGGTFDLGEDSGCNCPEGYALSNCNGELQCVQFATAPFTACPCYLATNCEDAGETIIIQLEDNSAMDVDLIYAFESEPGKCWSIEEHDSCDTTQVVVVEDSFATCVECAGTCYTLTNCETQEVTISDDAVLANHVGSVIEVEIDPDNIVCLTVGTIPCFGTTPVPVPGTILECHTTCEKCLPEPIPVPELIIRNRTVKPGYNTKGCSPEYVEKVTCNFAEALYQEVASRKYGIKFCCETDLDKWDIKKQLMELKALTDPEACVTSTNDCCPPCNVTAELMVFRTVPCAVPTDVTADIVIT